MDARVQDERVAELMNKNFWIAENCKRHTADEGL
jgi:hypothetical protein